MSETSSLSRNARKATQIREESRAHLQAQGVQEGSSVMAPKPIQAQLQPSRDMILTNMFAVKFDKPTRVHRYDLTITGITDEQQRLYDFTLRSGSDVQIVDRKEKCRAAFDLLVARRRDIFPTREQCIYDLQAILFTIQKLNINDRETIQLELSAEERAIQDSRGRPIFINSIALRFEIKTVHNFNLVLSNDTVLRSVNSNLEEQSSDLQQFIEILTSQHAFNDANEHVTFQGGRSYLIDPQAHGFQVQDFPDLGRGAYLAVGAQKSCKIVEGPSKDNPRLTVVVENKKTPFHAPTSVEHKLNVAFSGQFVPARDRAAASNLIRDLWLTTTYGNQPDFKALGLVAETARDKTFEHNGAQVSVEQYFAQTFQITLSHPDWPLIESRGRQHNNYYPIEVCSVCDNQRLTSSQLTPDQTSTIIRTCARVPREQARQIQQNFAALRINASPVLEAAGVDVGQNPIQVRGTSVPHPRMEFQSANVDFDPTRGEWRPPQNARFLLPARIQTWALYVSASQRVFPINLLQQFVANFMGRCRQQGILITEPLEQIYLENLDHLRARFDSARSFDDKVDLIMVITDRKDLEVHKILKSYEQEYDIVTQNVTSKVAADSLNQGGGRLTLANVVNKTNMKCGGLNYAVYPAGFKSPLGIDDLFIGFGSNHPGGYGSEDERKLGGAPSVIGYAANDLEHPCAFSGDYVFSESRRDEKVGVIDSIVKLCVQRYISNRKKNPKRVFVFRNGCSEGQFPSVLRFEVPLIERALKDLGVEAGLSLIVPNRMHSVRLTPVEPRGAKAWEQNLPCGTAVDTVINHPKFFDYYLLSHVARQGTAKVPRYTVLHDSNGLSSEEAITISYCLCFEHQIINGPTSFPTPVYIANRYAERGRMVYNVFQRTQLQAERDFPSHEDYNARLTYVDRQARNVRFNA